MRLNISNLILFVTYTASSVSGLLLVKRWISAARVLWSDGGGSFNRPALLLGLGAGLYVFSFLLWMVILARTELSISYPIAVGLTLVFSTLGATFLLKEPVTAFQIVGISLIFFGIVLVVRR